MSVGRRRVAGDVPKLTAVAVTAAMLTSGGLVSGSPGGMVGTLLPPAVAVDPAGASAG